MAVRIDHARDRDHSLGIDDEGVCRIDLAIDAGDAIAVDQDIAGRKVAVVVVHRDDVAASNQDFLTFARAFLSRLGATRTEARERGYARRRRKTRGRNSG
jgi:fructose-specific component phosphotransferase system IIB-like protein